MKYIFSLFLTLLSHCIFGQKIAIQVLDTSRKYLSGINVQLQKDGKTVDFKKTNSEGKCDFILISQDKYMLKFTSMEYKTKVVEIHYFENQNITIEFLPQVTPIKEVEIKHRPVLAKIKNDTIQYSLKTIIDGTEKKVEDIIKKILGLNIDEEGKVSFQGNTIGNILVEGNEFFGRNHKMATQNISSDMIEGIDLWNNYTTMGGKSSTALNLKLKKEFQGMIKGDVEGNYGYNKFYSFHNNIL